MKLIRENLWGQQNGKKVEKEEDEEEDFEETMRERRGALKVDKENVGEKGGRENREVRSPQSWVGSLKRPSKITYPSPAARARSLSPERAAREGSIVPKRKVVAMTLRFPRDTYTSTIRKKSFSAKMI